MFKASTLASGILKDHVVKKALREQTSYSNYQKKNLSPSGDFMCARKTFYNFKYSGGSHLAVDPRDTTYEGTRALFVGNAFHDYVQKQFAEAGCLLLNETTLIDEEHHIKARLDMVIEINKIPYLVELKSAKSYSIKLMKDDATPDIEHQKQTQLYFHLLEVNKDEPEIKAALQGRKVTKGIILYESKNDHTILEFAVDKNQEIINECLAYARYVWKRIQASKEPKVPFLPDSSECLYKCKAEYYEMCHGVPNPKKEPPAPQKALKDGTVWGFNNVKAVRDDESFV
jgi:hypothetical protein